MKKQIYDQEETYRLIQMFQKSKLSQIINSEASTHMTKSPTVHNKENIIIISSRDFASCPDMKDLNK